MSMYSRHGRRVSARGNGAGNFEFQGVVPAALGGAGRQRNEAGAKPGEPFSGISDMDPRSWASVKSAKAEIGRRFPWPIRWDQSD